MSIEGVDYSFDHPRIDALHSAGKQFAGRYIGPGSSGKLLRLVEAQALARHGIWVAAHAEGLASGLLGGWDTGVAWARSARWAANSLGMPTDRPVYLACDVDMDAARWPRVANALRGAASVLGRDWVGVYGEHDVIGWAARDGVACWLWQTYAWSSGRVHPYAHVLQYRNHVALGGGTVDLDRAFVADYGQWVPNMTTLPAALAPARGSRVLRLRSPMTFGGDVAFVQRHIGPYRCGRADGWFGPGTEAGVRWYQDRHDLAVDGIVGRATWTKMGVEVTF